MSITLDKAKMPTLGDKHRQQGEDAIKKKKSVRKKVENTNKGRSLKAKKRKKDGKEKK